MGRLARLAFLAGALGVAALPAAGAGAPPPARVASLNLCADEIALLVAAPGQLASVTWLAQQPEETALFRRAMGLHANRGTVESVAALRPDLILTGGFAPPYSRELARRLGARTLDLAAPQSIADLEGNIAATGAALGQPARARALIAAMRAALGPQPAVRQDALVVQGGGFTPRAAGLTATLLRHAGLEQRGSGDGRIALEALLARPPRVLVTSRYRPGEASLNAAWLRHPALARLPAGTRQLSLDGRAFLCPGPLAAFEVARLRARLATPDGAARAVPAPAMRP